MSRVPSLLQPRPSEDWTLTVRLLHHTLETSSFSLSPYAISGCVPLNLLPKPSIVCLLPSVPHCHFQIRPFILWLQMYAISSWHSGLADGVRVSYVVLGNFFISPSLKLLCVCVWRTEDNHKCQSFRCNNFISSNIISIIITIILKTGSLIDLEFSQ